MTVVNLGTGDVRVELTPGINPVIDVKPDTFMPAGSATAKEMSIILRTGTPTLDLLRILASAKTFRLAIQNSYVDATNPGAGEETILEYDALSNSLKLTPSLNLPNATGPIYSSEVTLTETTGAGLYTAAVVVPAEATLLDIRARSTVLWSATTMARLDVGDSNLAGGWFENVDLKALGDLLVGQEINFASPNGRAGTWLTDDYRTGAYSATARTVTFKVTTIGAAGASGITRGLVLYALSAPVAATKS